jgi:hypothetical protein
MSHDIARYGWIPYSPDRREHLYAVPVKLAGGLAMMGVSYDDSHCPLV